MVWIYTGYFERVRLKLAGEKKDTTAKLKGEGKMVRATIE
jgi:hypothetical protein